MSKKIGNSKEKEKFRAYFHNTVVLAYDAYIIQRNNGIAGRNADLRAFTNAAEHLYHVREHLPDEVSATWTEIYNRSADYALLGDIANALKHRKLTRGNLCLTNSENIYEQTVVTTFEDKKGNYSHSETVVIAELDDGTCHDVLDILTNVMNAWLTYCYDVGISTKKPKLFPIRDPHKIVKRKDARNHDYVITKGLELTQRFKLQKFNYVTGKVEPVNLTGSKIEYRIYRKPLRIADLQAVCPNGDKTLNFRIIFSDEEEKAIDKLKTKKSQEEFVKNLIHERTKRKRSIKCNDGSDEYEVLLPNEDFKKFMSLRKDETRQKFLTDFLKDLGKFSVEKEVIKGTK